MKMICMGGNLDSKVKVGDHTWACQYHPSPPPPPPPLSPSLIRGYDYRYCQGSVIFYGEWGATKRWF